MLKAKSAKVIAARLIKPTLVALALSLLVFISDSLIFSGRIYPGISIAGVYVGDKKPEEVVILLSKTLKPPSSIVLLSQNEKFEIPVSTIDFSFDHAASAQAGYYLYRTGNLFYDFSHRLEALFVKPNIGLRIKVDEEKLQENLSVIAGQVAIEPVFPSVKKDKGAVLVQKGIAGKEIDLKALRLMIGQTLAFAKSRPISIPTNPVDPSLSDSQAVIYKERAESLLGKSFSLNFESQTFTYTEDKFFDLLDPYGGYKEEKITRLTAEVTSEINREPKNPTFIFEAGRVKEFAPAEDGIKVNEGLLKDLVAEKLRQLEASDIKIASIEIPVKSTPPQVRTEDVNSLGIKGLLGRGSSRFRGSITSRIHNISVASSRFNGVLVKPGEVFSFNDVLGDVSFYTGYKQAYIIKDGKTVLGDGGGVCQVSTTLFRAIIDAGLPIVERRAHSYRVGYYEQDSLPGFDATVYSPTTDLKFKNDTPGHILIQTQVDPKRATLLFEIYGTSDGRVATTTKPLVTNVVPPPEDLYQDDPTLPEGTIKQIDWKAWGAKVTFNYKVLRGGEILYQKTFYSNYRPWQAVYLRGTAPGQ